MSNMIVLSFMYFFLYSWYLSDFVSPTAYKTSSFLFGRPKDVFPPTIEFGNIGRSRLEALQHHLQKCCVFQFVRSSILLECFRTLRDFQLLNSPRAWSRHSRESERVHKRFLRYHNRAEREFEIQRNRSEERGLHLGTAIHVRTSIRPNGRKPQQIKEGNRFDFVLPGEQNQSVSLRYRWIVGARFTIFRSTNARFEPHQSLLLSSLRFRTSHSSNSFV